MRWSMPSTDPVGFLSVSIISSIYIPSPIFVEFLFHAFSVAINPMLAALILSLGFSAYIRALTFKSAFMAPYLLNSPSDFAVVYIAMSIPFEIQRVRNWTHLYGPPPSHPPAFPTSALPTLLVCTRNRVSHTLSAFLCPSSRPSPPHSSMWTSFCFFILSFSYVQFTPHAPSRVYLKMGVLFMHFPPSNPHPRHL